MNYRIRVKLPAPWDGASAWGTILDDGAVEFELYDFSRKAESYFGNDVAWLYTISVAEKPKLLARLSIKLGLVIDDDSELLAACAVHFPHVDAIRDWLRAENIRFTERFRSQV